MKVNIKTIESYPKSTQDNIRSKVKDIVDETFIYTADGDYINARFLSLNHRYRAFFWPALQSIEKYLKANLLYCGVSVKGFGHSIVSMAKELASHDKVLSNLELVPNEIHSQLEQLSLWGPTSVDAFLEAIMKFGDPSNRYNYYGSNYEASYLLKLDQVVYALRSNIVGNEVLSDLKKRKNLEYYAYEQNVCFAPESYQHQDIDGKFGINISVPSIELALKGRYGNQMVFENWLKENIKITNDEIRKIKIR
mgnify:CR=1 FL=1|tara:strand:+ start:626 stop:1378 length:753 start_codon:yes stop_codon:yes gene_type:complete